MSYRSLLVYMLISALLASSTVVNVFSAIMSVKYVMPRTTLLGCQGGLTL